MTSLDVSNNTALHWLVCSENQLTSLVVSGNVVMQRLYCDANQLTTVDVSGDTSLQWLNCDWNEITTLNVSGDTALQGFSCIGNQLATLDISGNAVLQALDCSENKLTSLEVCGDVSLQYLNCYWNQLTALDVSDNVALQWFSCDFNQLTTLDISSNTTLQFLGCSENQLTTLDVSGLSYLSTLWCNYTPLTVVNIGGNDLLPPQSTTDDWSTNFVTDPGVVVNTVPVVMVDPIVDGSEGASWSGSGSFSDPDANTWTASVDYQDGTGTYPVTLNEDKTFTLNHVFADSGDYSATLTISDVYISKTYTFDVHVANVAPTAVVSNSGPVDIGNPATVNFSNTYDPSPTDTTAGFHYSFATDSVDLVTTYADAGTTASQNFTFADNGLYTVYGRIFDKDGGYSDYATTVTVNIGAPAAPSGLTAWGDYGGAYLYWNDNSSNETSFQIQRATDANFQFNVTSFTVAADATEAWDYGSGILSNVTYYYRIRAINSAGNSTYSATASCCTYGDWGLPATPSGFTA